ncbi:hypothetical protein KKF45_04720 [Patescibacteria group bacterium]|nr:hypothetical protein [Patescibacteria group bacterium]
MPIDITIMDKANANVATLVVERWSCNIDTQQKNFPIVALPTATSRNTPIGMDFGRMIQTFVLNGTFTSFSEFTDVRSKIITGWWDNRPAKLTIGTLTVSGQVANFTVTSDMERGEDVNIKFTINFNVATYVGV